MKLIIVRHGQTAANLESVVQKEDSPLSATGKKQVRALAEHLKNERIDAAYISDLPRTIQTADIILALHPTTKRTLAQELREKSAGVFVGQTYEAYRKARDISGLSFSEFRPEGGESIVDVQNRVVQLFERIKKAHANETVLFVSHAGTITCLLLFLLQKPFEQFSEYRAENTALTVIEVHDEGALTFHLLNSVAHIPRRLVPALFFHPLTPFYDIIAGLFGYGSLLQKKALGAAGIQDDNRVIDIGCGTGAFLVELKKIFPRAEATGVDPDPRVLAIARQKLEQAGFQANLEERYGEWLFFPPHSFDVAVSVLTFRHLSFEAKKRMMKDVHRILAEGGTFLLADFHAQKYTSLVEQAGFVVKEAAPRYRMVDFLIAKRA